MILGLPLQTWGLILVSTVPGLLLVAVVYVVHRGDAAGRDAGQEDGTGG